MGNETIYGDGLNDFKIGSKFCMKMLKWWYDFRENFAHDLLETGILWNNRLIKISGKSIFYHDYVKARITFCHDLHFEKGLFKVVRNSFPFSIPTELYERLTRL